MSVPSSTASFITPKSSLSADAAIDCNPQHEFPNSVFQAFQRSAIYRPDLRSGESCFASDGCTDTARRYSAAARKSVFKKPLFAGAIWPSREVTPEAVEAEHVVGETAVDLPSAWPVARVDLRRLSFVGMCWSEAWNPGCRIWDAWCIRVTAEKNKRRDGGPVRGAQSPSETCVDRTERSTGLGNRKQR